VYPALPPPRRPTMSFATSLSRTARPTLRMHAPRNVSAAAELKHAWGVPCRRTAPTNSSTAAIKNQGQTLVRNAVLTTTQTTRSGLVSTTIIGILLGLANFELIPVSLTPFGREIVDIDQAQRMGSQVAVTMPADPRR
jgi:hypothetical protein